MDWIKIIMVFVVMLIMATFAACNIPSDISITVRNEIRYDIEMSDCFEGCQKTGSLGVRGFYVVNGKSACECGEVIPPTMR